MTMQTAIATKHQRRTGLVAGIEVIAAKDVHARHFEGANIPLRSNWSEKGNNSHGASVAQSEEKVSPDNGTECRP